MKITPELVQRIMLARPSIEAMSNWIADELDRLAGIESRVDRAWEAEAGALDSYKRSLDSARDVIREARASCPHYVINGNLMCETCGRVNPGPREAKAIS